MNIAVAASEASKWKGPLIALAIGVGIVLVIEYLVRRNR